MEYLLLIYTEPSGADVSPEARQAMHLAYNAYTEWLAGTGWLRGGEALADVTAATTVQVRDGRRVVTDGPFAETKEVLGGYYLIDAPDIDAAIDAAARIPGAKDGKIEIRPIVPMAEPAHAG